MPSIKITPFWGSSCCNNSLNSVDFPVPEAPFSTYHFPLSNCKLTLLNNARSVVYPNSKSEIDRLFHANKTGFSMVLSLLASNLSILSSS